jgi:glycosyltransferase involved in cell wall biosynthesis
MINQLHLVVNASITSGGEGVAAFRYAETLAVVGGGGVTLLAKNAASQPNSDSEEVRVFDFQVLPFFHNFLPDWLNQYNFIELLCRQKRIQIIHLHGIWSPFLAVAALIAARKKILLVISPHGCLESWALGYKYYKKQLALNTYQGAVLRSAAMFIATAEQELVSIRKLGYRQPIAVIPNGVDVVSDRQCHQRVGIKTILFLSRLHPIKGLFDLVEAWAISRQPGWKIVIAGGDEVGYRAIVEKLIMAKGLQADFEFVGFVEGSRKQACFEEATLFVLPTYSENFGIAIAEAMAYELPVITTTGAPWRDLVKYRCGWWVSPGVPGLTGALIDALDCSSEELREMGRRGRQVVIDKYSWSNIGSLSLEVSEWLLNRSSPKPIFVNVVV